MSHLFKITAIGTTLCRPPIQAKLSLRGKGKSTVKGYVSKRPAICGCCRSTIAIGEQYFFLDYPCCLGCAKYESE